MPLTQKRKNFAHHIVSGMNGCDAYRHAGYSYKNMSPEALGSEVWKLRNHPEVAAHIKELQDALGKDQEITREWILEELKKVQQEARAAGQYGPAGTALFNIAKIKGEVTEKVESAVKLTPEDHKPDFREAFRPSKKEAPKGGSGNNGNGVPSGPTQSKPGYLN